MRSPVSWIVVATLVLASLGFVSNPSAAVEPPQREKPIREIFVPFEDLDLLLEGDAHRVFLQRTEYEDLIARAKTSPREETPRDWLTLAADYQVVIDDGRTTIQAELDLEVFSPGLFAIPLKLGGVGVRSALLDDTVAPLGRDNQGGIQVFVEGKGKHRLRLDLVTPLQTTAAQQSLNFELPSPPSRRMRLTVPGNVEVRGGAAVSSRTVDGDAGVTRFVLVPPRGPMALSMSLNNRTLLQQRVVMARSVMVDEVTQAYERLHATVSMGVLHGAVDQFRFQIPAGFEVSEVNSPLLSRWVVTPSAESNGNPILEVTLREPTTEIVVLNLSATATSPRLEAWSMPRFEPLDVNNHVAVVGLLVEDRLAVESISHEGLIPIDNAVLRSRLPASVFNAEPGAPQVRSVVVYYAPQTTFQLSARVTRPPARINVTSHILLSLDETEHTVRGGFSLQAEAEKIFAADLRIPAGWTMTAIKALDGTDLARESFVLPNGDTRMRVRLPQGVPLDERFEILFDASSTPVGWLDSWTEKEIDFPIFSVMNAARDRGAIAVQTTDDLVARPLAMNALIPLDEAEKIAFGLESSPVSLAYQFVEQPYSATIQVQRGAARLTARTFSFLLIEPDGLSAHYEVLFDVRQAKTKQLIFSLPNDTPTAVSVRGLDGVAVKEYNSETVDDRRHWIVLLAEGQTGLVRLAIDFSRPLGDEEPKGWKLPIAQAHGVVYQTAMVAVEGNSEFDIKLATSGRKIDVGELVDADYQVGRRLLGAYGFVGADPEVTVDVFRQPGYGLPAAIVERVEFVTLVSNSGRSQTVARYLLRTKATYLQIDLPIPDQTQLWSATLDGVPSTPQRDGDSLLLSLPPKSDQGIRDLQLVYESPIDKVSLMGDIRVLAPRLVVRGEDEDSKYEVPVADLTWDLVLPDGHRILRTDGTVFKISKSRRQSPLVVVAATLWELCGGNQNLFMARRGARRAPTSGVFSVDSAISRQATTTSESEPDSAALPQVRNFSRLNRDEAKLESDSEVLDLMADAPQAAPATPQLPAETAAPQAAGLQVEAEQLTQQQMDPFSENVSPDGKTVPGKYWALEGVRSLQIELHERGRRVHFQSMGASPVLRATLINAHRLTFLNYGLAMLVGLIGVGLTRHNTKRKTRFVIEVMLAALILPLVVGWIMELDFGATFDGAFYAACLVAAYYLLVAALKSLVRTARALRWPTGSPTPGGTAGDGRGNASSAATTTVASILLFLTLVPTSWAQPALPPGTALTPEGLANLLQPAPPIKLPDDAVIIPYNADDLNGLKNAERVMVPFDEYARLWNLAFPNQPLNLQKPPAAYALSGGQYTTVLEDGDQLTINGQIDVDLFVEEAVAIPLPLQRAVLARATLDGATARIQVIAPNTGASIAQPPANQQAAKPRAQPAAESFVVVHAQGKGRHRLEISVRLRLDRSGGWRQVDGVIPVAPSTKLSLTVPQAQTEVRLAAVADRSSFETSNDGDVLETAMNASGTLQLQWRPKVGAGEVDQSLIVQSAAVFDIQEDGLRLAWQMNLQFRTQRETFTIHVPRDYLVEKVTGDNVRGWTKKPAEAVEQLDVTLLKSTTGSETLTLFLSRRQVVGQAELATFEVPVVSVPDAVLHQGHLTIRRSPLLSVETENTVGVSRTDPTQESQAVIAAIQEESPLGIRGYQDFRFVTTKYVVALRAAPLADPQTTPLIERTSAALQTLLRLGARETSYESRVTINVKQRPVHQVRVLLPDGFEFDKVDAPGVFEQSITTQAGRSLLTVYLAEGQRAPFSILLGGHVNRLAAAGDVALPNFEVLDVGEQDGYFAIQVDPAFRVIMTAPTNCESVPLTRVMDWLNPAQRTHTDLAVFYGSSDYSATLQTTAVLPDVASSTITNVRVTTREIEETVLLRFTITKAGIREIVFRLPVRLRDAQITAPMLRQKTVQDVEGDTNLVEVKLELQDDKMGELIVVVQNDVALSGTRHEVPIPVVLTGRSQQRYVVLENAGRDEVVVADMVGMETLRRDRIKWATLAEMLENKSTQAFEMNAGDNPQIAFSTKRRDVVETAGAAIRLAQATVVVDGSGTYRVLQEFRVDNQTEQYLEIELPEGAQLWTVQVANEPVKPTVVPASGSDRQLRIPLIKTALGDLDYPVQIKYGGQLGAFSAFRRIEFPLVKTRKIQVERSLVRLHLPNTHRFFGFDGTMEQVTDEGDLKADFLSYQNRQIELLQRAMTGNGGLFMKMRAANNLKQLGLAMQNNQAAYRKFNSNSKFQQQLRHNNEVFAEANRQMKSQEEELKSQLITGNRDRLFSAYDAQKAGKSSNIVNNLESNFFRPEVTLQSQVELSDGTASFNSKWLDSNQLGTRQPAKKADQLDRITVGKNKAKAEKAASASVEKSLEELPLPQRVPRFRTAQEDKPAATTRNQTNDLNKQVERYQSQLNDQARSLSILPAEPNADEDQAGARFGRDSQRSSGQQAETPHDAFGASGMAGGMGGGGGFGMTPGQAGNARSRGDGEQLAPPMAEGLGRNMDGGEQSQQEFTYDGLAPGPTPGNTGLASLDFQLPVRGNEYFFTTPRGDTRITVQAIEQRQIQRFEQLGVILVCFAVIGGLVWLVVRIYSLLSRRVRATLLILLGVASLISGVLMVMGLLALIWGIGLLAASWFLPNESTQPASAGTR